MYEVKHLAEASIFMPSDEDAPLENWKKFVADVPGSA